MSAHSDRARELIASLVGTMCDWDSEIAPAIDAALELARAEGMLNGYALGWSLNPVPDVPFQETAQYDEIVNNLKATQEAVDAVRRDGP